MKRIEDIRPAKKRSHQEDLPPVNFSTEDFYAEAPTPPVVEPELPAPELRKPHNPRKVRTGWLIFSLILIAIIFFCGFELIKAKSIISSNIYGLNSSFSALTDSMSKKDFVSIGDQVKDLNNKTADSILVLQSVGQDVYVFNLLYPVGKSSKITSEIDLIRGAHLLTNSFNQILNFESGSTLSGAEYLDKINDLLGGFSQVLAVAPDKIKLARFFSHEAKSLTASFQLDQFGPSEQKSISNLQKFSSTSADFFDYLSSVPGNLSDVLSISGGKKSYLILFLNNAEIRPGGGFIGSFARLDLENGKAVGLDFEKNIYTLDKAFISAGNSVTPPAEISALTPNWTMRDSNVYADFAKSSEKVSWFYQQETGKKVDGVISIDTTLFRNLLKATGPVNMPEYNMEVTDQNFLSDVQYQVEIGYYQNKDNWSENQPKKILADLMPKFVAAMTKNPAVQSQVGREIAKAISEKHFMIYTTNSVVADLIDGIGLSGKVREVSGDYLYLSDANIGGLKSSLNIAESVTHDVEILGNGDVKEKVTILRKHNGSYEWPDGINNNFLKVFLPLSSKIDSVNFIAGDNFPKSDPNLKTDLLYEVEAESGKQTVSFWQNTKPGEESSTEVSYTRNSGITTTDQSFEYQITIQKQPGVETYDWNLYLVYPEGWKPQNVEGFDANNRRIFLHQTISKDSVFRLRFIRD